MDETLSEIFTLDAGSHLPIYVKGLNLAEGKLPALFYFALSGEESLTLNPFCQPVDFASQLPLRSFSFTLPFHGLGQERSQAMSFWAKSFAEGGAVFEQFLEQALVNIDYLIQSKIIDPNYIAVGGLSRGGFIATHLAARHPQINFLLGHAPLLTLSTLSEFKNEEILNSVYNCQQLIPQLLDKKVFFLIGNHDTRVSTAVCTNFICELASAMFLQGQRSPAAELLLFPSIGHHGHGTPPEIFKAGINWLAKQWQLN